MFTRRICSLFACSAVALLLLVFCTGDSALSGNGQALPILMYHDVVEDGQPYNTWTVTAGRFRQDLQWLKDHGYACVLPRELARGHLPRGKAVLITFDDGYESNYRLAFPILKEFGSHTYDLHHDQPRGIRRAPGETREAYDQRVLPDLETSVDLIQKNLNTKVLYFAYPYGQKEPWSSDFLQKRFAMTVTTKYGRANLSGGRYDLPRYTISMEESVAHHLGGTP